MANEFEKCMEKHMASIDKSLDSISESLERIATAKEKVLVESGKESWDVFDKLSKLSGTKLL